MNQKMLKNINICVIIVGLCLFSMWCGAVINGANATANTIDLSGLTPEESGGIPINYDFPDDKYDNLKAENKYVAETINVGELV
ncbi:MAG: hypothetical protein M0R51_08580 [Clostridia bacterium]|nr:hypothetical protein [Clostridia bacterium]